MRRNPRPFHSVDRRRLAIEIIEREARSMSISSQSAMEGMRDRLLQRTSSPVKDEGPAIPSAGRAG